MAGLASKTLQFAAMATAVGLCHAFSQDSKYFLDSFDTSASESMPPPPAIPKEDIFKQFSQSAIDFCSFVDRSPSVYHAVEEVNHRLRLQGFQRLYERDSWSGQIQPGGRYYVVRNDTSGASVITFAVGKLWKPGNPFATIATHVDSPCLKLKPVSRRYRSPFLLAGVQTYGGGLWHTWFDRDLSAAGRVMLRTESGDIESRLVNIGRPILRIPSLAVHYDKQNPFKFNTELDLLPVAGMTDSVSLIKRVQQSVNGGSPGAKPASASRSREDLAPVFNRHGEIANIVAETLSVRSEDIIDFDLSLYDTQRAMIGGEQSEFIFASRIDNLMMTFCALEGFTRSLADLHALDSERSVRLLAMFDSEEISSGTEQGGKSNFLSSTLQRITNESSDGTAPKSAFERSMARSFLISADMQHAQHPHQHGWHETNHSCWMNNGLAISSDNGRHLVKNTPGSVLLMEIPRRGLVAYEGMPFNFQFFTRPNNVICGSTLGPILSTKLGVRTVDMGNAQLSMHSIREMAGTWDVEHASRFLHLFFERFSEVDQAIDID